MSILNPSFFVSFVIFVCFVVVRFCCWRFPVW